jgi:tRNA pseudouridine-54 N-methylase
MILRVGNTFIHNSACINYVSYKLTMLHPQIHLYFKNPLFIIVDHITPSQTAFYFTVKILVMDK